MGKVLPKLTVPDKTWKVWKQKSGKMEENMKKNKKRRNNSIKDMHFWIQRLFKANICLKDNDLEQ